MVGVWGLWGRLGVLLGPSWALLGPSWGPLGTLLEPSWALLGRFWGHLGADMPVAWQFAPVSAHVQNHQKTIVNIAFLGPRVSQDGPKLGQVRPSWA